MDPQPLQPSGAAYIPAFLAKQEEQAIIGVIRSKPWNTALKRRTQHYGYEYGYDRKSVATKTNEIPEQFIPIKERLEKVLSNQLKMSEGPYIFDQMIINEYEPGQGISPHIDNTQLFDSIVVSVSLGS